MLTKLIENKNKLLWIFTGVLVVCGIFVARELLLGAVSFITFLFLDAKSEQTRHRETKLRLQAERAAAAAEAGRKAMAVREAKIQKEVNQARADKEKEIDSFLDGEFK